MVKTQTCANCGHDFNNHETKDGFRYFCNKKYCRCWKFTPQTQSQENLSIARTDNPDTLRGSDTSKSDEEILKDDGFLTEAIEERQGMYERRKGTMDEEVHKQMLEFLVTLKLDHERRIKLARESERAYWLQEIIDVKNEVIKQEKRKFLAFIFG